MESIKKHFHSPALSLFIIRIVAGGIFMFHGISKLSNMEGTVMFFASLGFGAALAWIVALIETIGGLAIIVGYATKIFAPLLAVIMLVAIFKVKLAGGFMKLEIDLMLFTTMIALLFSGCGQYSICKLWHKDCASCASTGNCGCNCGMTPPVEK